MNNLFGKSHTEISDINLGKVHIIGNRLVLRNYKYKKAYELIFKCDKYKIGSYPLMMPPSDSDKINIKLSLESVGPIEESELYKFGQSYIKTTTNGLKNIYIFSNKNRLHISHMEKLNYPIIEVITGENLIKPIIRFHKPSNIDELKNILKPDYEIIPFVQMFKYLNIETKSYYMLLHPVKFYIGKKLDKETMELVLPKRQKPNIGPKPEGDYYHSEQPQIVSKISVDMLEESLDSFPKPEMKPLITNEFNIPKFDLDEVPELEEVD